MDKNTGIKIKDVDENGSIIKNVDWSVWRRVRCEEVFDDNETLIEIIAHCEHIPSEEIAMQNLSEIEQNLKATDYISSKFGDELMSCNDISEVATLIATFKTRYGNMLSQRQEWRNEINKLRETI